MAKKNFTEIAIVIDKSGSMGSLVKDTLGGYNTFIEKQKALPGDASVTLVLFDTDIKTIYESVDIKNVKELTTKEYFADGLTALNDAIGLTIDSLGKRLDATAEENRPEKVVVVIMTDGEENSSNRYTNDKIKEMVEHQKNKYSWEFCFLGANIDSFAVGGSYGISNNINYSASVVGTKLAYATMDNITSNVRSGRATMSNVSTDIRDTNV